MAVRPRARRINLLPSELKPKVELQHEALSLGIGILFVVSAIITSTSQHFAIQNRQRQLASIKTEESEVEAQVVALTAKSAQAAEKQARYASFQEVLNRKTYWVEMFKELTSVMPKDVWLTHLQSSVSERDKNIVLQGEAASQEKVAEFLRALEKSQYFNTIVVKTSEKQDDYRPDLYKFEFSFPGRTVAPVVTAPTAPAAAAPTPATGAKT
jgi:Tfp pilus assembly protein PilN